MPTADLDWRTGCPSDSRTSASRVRSPYLRPDGKTQVTYEYALTAGRWALKAVLISTQHAQEGVDRESP
jgi:S-adenosylmethionine synthetase